ncbi:hypothetical protein ABPG75_002868 [Micractinium tetrahymenae]
MEGTLPGEPSLPFYVRCNRLRAQQPTGTLMVMAVATLVAYRCWDLLSPAALSWLLTAYALCLLDLVWRRRWPTSYRRWREALVALLWLNCFRAAAPWSLMSRFLDHLGPQAVGGGMAAHAARLLFASGAPQMAVHLLALRMRLSVGALVQLAVVAASLPHNPAICAAAPLAHPRAQQFTRQLYLLLAAVASWVGPAHGQGATPSPEQQCAVLLTWLRVSGALLAPLMWQLLSEARLFRRHQAQRRQAGMALERGLHAAVYSAVASLSQGRGLLHVLIVIWLCLVVSWTLSALLAMAVAPWQLPMPA